MNQMIRKQGGITAIGIFLMLGVLACFVLAGLKAFPLYNEYISVISSMESVSNQPPANIKRTKDVYKVFVKNVQINGVERFNSGNIKQFATVTKSKKTKKRTLNIKYQSQNNLFKNLFFMMDVDESVDLDKKGGAE